MFGILNLNKPPGMTSRAVVTRVSRILGRKIKCGHAGTLDPLATGVLLVCVGKATKLVPLIHDHSKSYEGTFLLGKKSVTDDVEADLETVPVPANLNEQTLREFIPEFTGKVKQIPPTHSAIWINGERAYDVARRGEEIDMPEREVQVDALELTQFSLESFSLKMTCGTGTYVRSIGRDLARRAGTEAVMSQLKRTSIGPFSIKDSVELADLNRENIRQALKNPLSVLAHLPEYHATQKEETSLRYGQRVEASSPIKRISEEASQIVVTDGGDRLIAIAQQQATQLAPQIVFPELE